MSCVKPEEASSLSFSTCAHGCGQNQIGTMYEPSCNLNQTWVPVILLGVEVAILAKLNSPLFGNGSEGSPHGLAVAICNNAAHMLHLLGDQ